MKMSLAVCGLLFACLLLGAGASGASEDAAGVLVDDDGVQCPDATFSSIQAAVDAADPGATIRVCPGMYPEAVIASKTLTIRGAPQLVEALDCFSPAPHVLSTDEYSIVAPVDPQGVAFTVAADGVVVGGLVVEGGALGVVTSSGGILQSGFRIHHNLFRRQRQFASPAGLVGGYGVDVASSGVADSRVDHNCFRETLRIVGTGTGEGFGIATDRGDVFDARIDHNETFRLNKGVEIIGTGRHERVSIDHNISVADVVGIHLWSSSASRIAGNESSGARTVGIQIGGLNDGPADDDGLLVTDNLVTGGFTGIAFTNVAGRPATIVRGITVRHNVVTGMALDGIVAAPGVLRDSLLDANVSSGNRRDGIVLRTGSAENTLQHNIADGNGLNGINAQPGTVGNVFVRNSMHGNGTIPQLPPAPNGVDARDSFLPGTTTLANEWVANDCATDAPAGAICPTD